MAKCFFINGTATWFGPDLTCLPIDCGPPQDILHGLMAGGCTSYRCQIVYDCKPGFQVVGGATRICQSDGTWTSGELPTVRTVGLTSEGKDRNTFSVSQSSATSLATQTMARQSTLPSATSQWSSTSATLATCWWGMERGKLLLNIGAI